MIGICYSRISSTAQVAGLGLDRQAAAPESYCAARGWELWDGPGYSDAGRSAFGGDNLDKALGRFLSDLRTGRFGPGPIALLVEDLDRFSRSFPLAVLPVLVDDILNAGVTISVMAKGRDISRASIQQNQMELHELLFWLSSAHEFSARLSRRISHVHDVKRQRIRAGLPVTPSSAPFWLDLVEGKWQLNQHAAIVRRILDLARDHGGTHIAGILNGEGIPSPAAIRQQRARRRTGKISTTQLWDGQSVLRIVEQPAIHGARQIVTPGAKAEIRAWREQCALLRRQGITEMPPHPRRQYEPPQPDYYPAILSEADHAALLQRMKARRCKPLGRGDQVRWIGAGLSWCICGEQIGASCHSRPGGRQVRYLRCRGRHRGSGCLRPTTLMQPAQAALLTRLAAEDYLTMLRGHQQGAGLAQALAERDQAQAAVDLAQQQLAAGEAAMAEATEAAVLVVLARRQAAAEQQLERAREKLTAATVALQQAQGPQSLARLSEEAQSTIRHLLAQFAAGTDSINDRRLVRTHLARLDLRIVIDGAGRRMGLALGEGELDWQPLDAELSAYALAAGATGATFAGGDEAGMVSWDEG